MRVIIGCEYSQIVMTAFLKKGHDAYSCDIIPAEGDYPERHFQEDILKVLKRESFDLGIFHPPCTFISYAGMSSWDNPGRVFKRLEALMFFAKLWDAPIEKICLENPKSCASPVIAKYSQEIQPYYFGDPHIKTTWLWLKNLPKLKYEKQDGLFGQKTILERPEPLSIDNTQRKHKRYFIDSVMRKSKKRSKFWEGIANAMANQWG